MKLFPSCFKASYGFSFFSYFSSCEEYRDANLESVCLVRVANQSEQLLPFFRFANQRSRYQRNKNVEFQQGLREREGARLSSSAKCAGHLFGTLCKRIPLYSGGKENIVILLIIVTCVNS